MPNRNPLLSIIVVTFRDVAGVRQTLGSVQELKLEAQAEIEVIVVDGGTGGTFESVVHDFSGWTDITTEPDSGIYDAMNKGLERSSGDFVWFLNGGDRSVVPDWQSLKGVLVDNSGGGMVFGSYVLDTGHRLIPRVSRGSWYLIHGLPTSHQAILYPGGVVRSLKYDLSYSVTGDYEMTSRARVAGTQVKVVKLELARFGTGGTSQQRSDQIAIEAGRVQREVLKVPLPARAASRGLHHISRIIRDRLTRSA
jgi:putative colanic acid biosynthesis glycosyltransferase